MSQIQETKEITLKDKLHKIADTLRNCEDIKQCKHSLIATDHSTGGHKMCAFGALAFRAGLPTKDILGLKDEYERISKMYGFEKNDYINKRFTISDKTDRLLRNRENVMLSEWDGKMTITGIISLNDTLGYSFNKIADEVDYWATQVD